MFMLIRHNTHLFALQIKAYDKLKRIHFVNVCASSLKYFRKLLPRTEIEGIETRP